MWSSTSVDIRWYTYKVKQPYMQKIFFRLIHRGSVRVKLTKCDKVEWGEKCHYVSDIPFEWLHFWFVILLSYYFILRESDSLRNLAISYLWSLNYLENFSASILLLKVSKYWKIVEIRKISINLKNCKTFYETQTASHFKKIIQPLPTPYTTR